VRTKPRAEPVESFVSIPFLASLFLDFPTLLLD